ncbi:twin-arginine translocation signal domain-containing protein [Salinivibrio costicola]|uniref:Twin-arginine translocation signal domain-containing protein n=1 Tax=Salinivibrio costicola TaxID=51367 RepID=A0ABX6K301_SALCS|nr:twin-arginine translocation signal domain-containing protein [Salinivibrio costicola]QIR05938.1 twin-arginine translocation signal domain-containing protein [Salinivibrio costicola]
MKSKCNVWEGLRSQSRRRFLTHSSAAVLTMAAATVLPKSVKAAHWIAPTTSAGLSELDAISFYTDSSEHRGLGLDRVDFETPTDEANYLAHVMFQNMMKHNFRIHHSGLSSDIGGAVEPNDDVLAMHDNQQSVSDVYARYQTYFNDYMAEYISQYLQYGYKGQENVDVNDRLAYNSWDMIKAHANIDLAEKGETFKQIIDELYAIATNYCQSNVLGQYKQNASYWLDELVTYYQQDSTLESLLNDCAVNDNADNRFNIAVQKVNATSAKIRTLNIAAGRPKTENTLREIERVLFGTVINGVAFSLRWGSESDQYSVLANEENFLAVARILQNNDSPIQSQFWRQFFSNNGGVYSVWNTFKGLGLRDETLGNDATQQALTRQYPELATPVSGQRSMTDVVLSSLTLLLGVGHFTWASATDREEWDNPVELIGLGAAFIETSLQISYEILATKVTHFLFGNGTPITDELAKVMAKFSQFLGKLTGRVANFINVERRIAESLFLGKISSLVNKCFVGLAFIAVGIASWNLGQAIASGDTADIVWASVNFLISGAAFGLAVAALMGSVLAGPLGIVVAIVGIVIAIAQWIFDALRQPEPRPSPIQRYTNEVVQPADLIHADIGQYICRTRIYWDRHVCFRPFDVKTMNTDWEYIQSVEDTVGREVLGTMISSQITGRTYYFGGDFDYPEFGRTDRFFSDGFNDSLSYEQWNPDWHIKRCTIASECVNRYFNSQALFLCEDSSYRKNLYFTQGIEDAPQSSDIIQLPSSRPQDIIDIVAVHQQQSCIFIVVCKDKHVYQVKDGRVSLITEDFTDGYPDDYFPSLTTVCTGDMVSIFYTLKLDGVAEEDRRLYQTIIERDEQHNFTQVRLLQDMPLPEGGTSWGLQIVGHYSPPEGDNDGRHEFILVTQNRYKRFGAIEAKQQTQGEGKALRLFGGVEFYVPNSGFHGFYKNTFMPR